MQNEVQYQLGDMHARIRNLEDSTARLESKMDTMQDTMNQAVGGFKALRIAGALAIPVAGLIGALLSKLLHWVGVAGTDG